MKKLKDPIDIWTAKPEDLSSETRAAYIFILQRYLSPYKIGDEKVRARIAALAN